MTPMTCRRAVELLIDYVARELPPDVQTLLDEHLRKCPPCLIYCESYEVTIRLTRQLPREAPIPPELEARMLQVLQQVRQDDSASV